MKLENGNYYRLKDTGEVGQLEAPPLYDAGSLPPEAQETTGILWIPRFGDVADRWVYVEESDLLPHAMMYWPQP